MASVGPNSPGTSVTALHGAIDWTTPNNCKIDDANYAIVPFAGLAGSTSYYLEATNFGFAIPVDSTIDGIVVEIKRVADYDDIQRYVVDETVSIIKGGAIGATNYKSATHWSIVEGYFSYGTGVTDKWGESWLVGDINDNAFGVALAVTVYGNDYPPPNASYVNHIRITVYYAEASPEPPAPDKIFCSPTRLVRVVTGCRNNMPVRVVTTGGDPVRIVAHGGEPVRVVTHGGDPVRIVEGEI